MALFLGIAKHTMDGKGRVSLPANYRKSLAGTELVLAFGKKNCIWVYTPEVFEKIIAQPLADDLDDSLDPVRMLLMSRSSSVELDSAGRILVPADKREYANLTKSITIAGTGNRFELWDSDAYDIYTKSINEEEAFAVLQNRRKAQQS